MAFERILASREAKQDRKTAAAGDFLNARYDIHKLDQERPLDALKTDDKEILGESKELSHFLRDRYRYVTDAIEKRIEKAEERVIESGDTVDQKEQKKYRREKYLDYRNNRIDIKIARLQDSITNSSGSFLANQINRQRRQSLAQLQYLKKVHTNQLGKLDQQRQSKPEELRKKVDQIVKRKIDAMYRKELRKRRLLDQDQKGIGKYDLTKRVIHKAEYISKMQPNEKKKIVREAILLARKQNIEKGRLAVDYHIDDAHNSRKVTEHYERITK